MHLSKIALLGFKSFADRIELAFEPGITGIVGPNGCGKSNISDALRWALGEQSAKLLRGDRMDDLIFAGNARRKPVGMAEVALTFTKNGAGTTVQTEYEEVCVARRLYRSGESEYLLNKVPCRLRDVTDMFIDTGLAGEPYALIEQGSIGSVVNARPADRRVLIEEAAGIMRYKTKKRAAVGKLEATEQNLLRIRDVIAEVERTRNSLKRQANKAERYKLLDERATALKLYLKFREHGTLWERLQGVLARLQPDRDALLALRAAIQAAEAALEVLRARAVGEEQAVSAAQEALYALRGQIDRDESELRHLTDQAAAAERRRAEGQAQLAALGATVQDLAGKLDEGAARVEDEGRGIAELEAALEAEGGTARELEREQGAAVGGLEGLRRSAAHQAGQLALKRNEVATLQERARQMEAQAERLRLRRAEAATQREGAEASSTTDEARRDEALDRRLKARAAREASQREAEHGREARRRLEAEIATLSADVERQRGRLSSLRELRLRYADFSEGNKLLLEAARDRRLSGVLGPLAELLEVAPRHEKALEAILGAQLQGLRLSSWPEAQEALAHLFRSGKGRATLLGPVTAADDGWAVAARAALAAQLAALPGEVRAHVEGLALDLVQVPAGGDAWVANLLADALVVGDLDVAIAAARALRGPFTLATLAGEVLTHRGTLVGGTAAPPGLLGQRRELRDLEEALSISEVGLAGLREALSLVGDEVTAAERAVEAAGLAERQAELELVAVEKDLAARRAEEARLSQQLDLFGTEIQSLERDLGRIAADLEALRAQAAQGEAAAASLGQQIAEQEARVADLRARREEAAAGLAERRVTLASRCARRDETLRDLARMQAERTAAEEQSARLEREGRELAVQQGERDAAMQTLRERLAAARGQEDARQSALLAAQEARAAGQERMREQEETLRTRRREEAEAGERLAELEAHRGELKTTLGLLEEGLLQDHQLGLPELRERYGEWTLELEAARAELEELRGKLADLGPANLGALEEYEALCQRHTFLTSQAEDLTVSVAALRDAIAEINKTIQSLFSQTLEAVNAQFDRFWRRLIGGGSAQLRLVDAGEEDAEDEPGVEMVVRIPGKRATVLSLLSGGERALAALSLLLALFAVRPSPFCVLDEVDAPLDEANVERFVSVLRDMSATSQFIVITHNRRTMEAADLLYGVTMEEEGISKVISVRMRQAA